MDIKKRIKDLGFTSAEIAKKIGITPSAFSQVINNNPQLSRLQEIAYAMGISLSEFFDENYKPQSDFCAFIRGHRSVFFAKSLDELEKIVQQLRDEEEAGSKG